MILNSLTDYVKNMKFSKPDGVRSLKAFPIHYHKILSFEIHAWTAAPFLTFTQNIQCLNSKYDIGSLINYLYSLNSLYINFYVIRVK